METDLISRQAAQTELMMKCERYTLAREESNGMVGHVEWSSDLISVAYAMDAIRDLPSAQPELPPYVAEIESEYRKAVSMPHIKKPLAKALFEVWKKHDREDAERRADETD